VKVVARGLPASVASTSRNVAIYPVAFLHWAVFLSAALPVSDSGIQVAEQTCRTLGPNPSIIVADVDRCKSSYEMRHLSLHVLGFDLQRIYNARHNGSRSMQRANSWCMRVDCRSAGVPLRRLILPRAAGEGAIDELLCDDNRPTGRAWHLSGRQRDIPIDSTNVGFSGAVAHTNANVAS
jgi:hypothetical protein